MKICEGLLRYSIFYIYMKTTQNFDNQKQQLHIHNQKDVFIDSFLAAQNQRYQRLHPKIVSVAAVLLTRSRSHGRPAHVGRSRIHRASIYCSRAYITNGAPNAANARLQRLAHR